MPNEIDISVIMPAYNAEKYISEAINSVIGQSYPNWELIIIDDSSKDSTLDIIKELLKKDERIILLQNKDNKGVSYSRNLGIKKAKYNWIAFLDSDDIWTEDKLYKQVEALNDNTQMDLIYTGSAFINRMGDYSSYILSVPMRITYYELLKQNLISCSSVLIKKELLEKYEMKYDDMHEDFAVWLQILKAGYKAMGVNEPLLIYRLSDNSKSSDKRKAAMMTYKVYRYLKLSYISSVYYLGWYSVKNIKKYRMILKGFQK